MYRFSIFEGDIIRIADGAIIPEVADNADYIVYLQWVADGGITLPAEPIPLGIVNATLFKKIRAELLPPP